MLDINQDPVKCVVSMLMEWINGRNLIQFVREMNVGASETRARIVASQLCEGIAYIHANRVIHGNVHPSNVMIDDNANVKLVGFGMARIINNDYDSDTTDGGIGGATWDSDWSAFEAWITHDNDLQANTDHNAQWKGAHRLTEEHDKNADNNVDKNAGSPLEYFDIYFESF